MRKSYTKGTPEQFASALEDQIAKLGGNVESNTSIMSSSNKFKVGDRVRQAWANPGNTGVVEDVMDDNTYGVRWNYSDGDDFEYVSGEDLDTYSEEGSEVTIEEYADSLGSEVILRLSEQGFDGFYKVGDKYLSIELDDPMINGDGVFLQPLSDIEPDWNDFDKDVDSLVREIIDLYFV